MNGDTFFQLTHPDPGCPGSSLPAAGRPLFGKLCFIQKYELRGKQENNEYTTLNNQCRTMKNTSIRS